MKKLIMVLVISILTAGALSAQQLPLNEVIKRSARGVEETLPQGTMVAILNFSSPSETFSDYVIEELTGELVMGQKVAIVDRQNLTLISKEMNLQMSGNVSDESAQAIGRLLGAQTIVSGTLTDMGTYHRFRIRVISVETARIQTQVSLDLQNDAQVAYLLGGDSKSASRTKTAKPVSSDGSDDRFDLDNKNVFAIGVYPWVFMELDIGFSITVFERHFSGGFVPGISFFIDASWNRGQWSWSGTTMGGGVLARWRPGHQNRFLLNLGGSFEFFVGEARYVDEDVDTGFWMIGMGVKGGLSFRPWRNIALDLQGFFKFGFDSVDFDSLYEPFTPIIAGASFGVTFMVPY